MSHSAVPRTQKKLKRAQSIVVYIDEHRVAQRRENKIGVRVGKNCC